MKKYIFNLKCIAGDSHIFMHPSQPHILSICDFLLHISCIKIVMSRTMKVETKIP